MSNKDNSQPSRFSREVQASEDLRGGKTREEFDKDIRKRKAEIRAFGEEMKRKAAEEKAQQQQQEEELSSEDDNNNDDVEEE